MGMVVYPTTEVAKVALPVQAVQMVFRSGAFVDLVVRHAFPEQAEDMPAILMEVDFSTG